MDIRQFMADPAEKPLDRLTVNGGFCRIFRTIGCVGDSLSSGEFEGTGEDGKTTYHDFYEYSWGQHIARAAGCKVYNFSRGGMTAKEYCESFAEKNGFWDADKACQAYILALGVNDLYGKSMPVGSVSDICREDPTKNAPTFAGYYAQIISRLKEISPDAKFFLMTMPREPFRDDNAVQQQQVQGHRALLYDMAAYFENTYVLDLFEYAPPYDAAFKKSFYLGHHMNPAGYVLTAEMVMAYIDYIIRQHPRDFAKTGFIGTPYRNTAAP